MQNFFKEKTTKNYQETTTNPFAVKTQETPVLNGDIKTGKRLNITDMEVLNSNGANSEIEFLEIKMNNLSQIIHQHSKNLDPVSIEKMKIEWEDIRDRVYQLKKAQKKSLKMNNNSYIAMLKTFGHGFSKLITMFKINSPKFKKIINTFNEINAEVEALVKRSTPLGEEEIKYGILVNKIYQATKLNGALTNEIK